MDALRFLSRLTPAVAIVAALAAAATAQPPGPPPGGGFGPPGGGPGGRGPGGGIGMLLRSDEVREELELMDDQVEKLQALEEEMRDKIRSEMGGRFRDGGRPDFEEMRSRFDELRKEVEGRLAEVLTTQQMERLKQIETQQQLDRGGARSLMGGPLADKLGLTDEQKAQLREKAREIQAKLQEKMATARAEAREEMLSILTSEQRATLDEMTGAPFTMSDPPQGPPGFDRGGRRGDRPGPPDGERGRRRGGRPGPPPADAEPEL